MKALRMILIVVTSLWGSIASLAQSSLPAPGGASGGGPHAGSSLPAPGGVAGSRYWGNPWNNGWGGNGWNYPPASVGDWQNSGMINVMGCGYDAQGVWRVIPMRVAYSYNGLQYNVTVINAWNPWSDMWNYGVDQPAYSTSYYLRGMTFSYYATLSTGTYYFNL